MLINCWINEDNIKDLTCVFKLIQFIWVVHFERERPVILLDKREREPKTSWKKHNSLLFLLLSFFNLTRSPLCWYPFICGFPESGVNKGLTSMAVAQGDSCFELLWKRLHAPLKWNWFLWCWQTLLSKNLFLKFHSLTGLFIFHYFICFNFCLDNCGGLHVRFIEEIFPFHTFLDFIFSIFFSFT